MTSAARARPAAIPSSETLRRAALARSAKRGARVAFWRLALRWAWWALGWLLVLLGGAALLAALLWGLWRATASLTAPTRALPSPLGTQTPALPSPPAPAPPIPRFPLRLDDDDGQISPTAAAQSRPASSPRTRATP